MFILINKKLNNRNHVSFFWERTFITHKLIIGQPPYTYQQIAPTSGPGPLGLTVIKDLFGSWDIFPPKVSDSVGSESLYSIITVRFGPHTFQYELQDSLSQNIITCNILKWHHSFLGRPLVHQLLKTIDNNSHKSIDKEESNRTTILNRNVSLTTRYWKSG